AQRLPNGNTLIDCGRPGWFFEITSSGEIVWQYLNPVIISGPLNQGDTLTVGDLNVFRCRRYPLDYPGLDGRDLSPGAPVEGYPVTIAGTSHSPLSPWATDAVTITSTISSDDGIALAEVYIDTGNGFVAVGMFDDGLHGDGAAGDSVYGAIIADQPSSGTVSYYIYAENSLADGVDDPPYAPVNAVYQYSVLCCLANAGNVNGDGSDAVDISDLTLLVNHLFVTYESLPCPAEANTNGDVSCSIDISDLTKLVNHLFVTFESMPPCGPGCD
ncbi:MAG: choice-of-anchor X domain-containing protein, partial [candidate division Zixibacteria bacterium]